MKLVKAPNNLSQAPSPSTSLQADRSLFMVAAMTGGERIVELLLNNNADPNLQDKVQHMAPPLPSAPSAHLSLRPPQALNPKP